jgi:glycosyltransferase involved in cell wall biosynthesis
MAGKDKGLQTDLINYAEVLGLTTNVKFPGFLNFQEKIQAFDKADIFISTNSVDNTPVSIVEAWAMGLPVVSTAVGGIADLIEDGETGLLVPDDDDYAMATAIRRLLENPELVEKISRKGKEKAQKFSWFEVQRLWEEIISEAINGETRRSL